MMEKNIYGSMLVVMFALFLTGCGGSTSEEVARVGEVSSGNVAAVAPVESPATTDSGYAEAIQMGGAKNAEVEARSGLVLPEGALVFTVIENKNTSTYAFNFYSSMDAAALKTYVDQQFSSQGYSQKRPWMNFVGTVQTGLYVKGSSLINVSVDDRGDHRYVDITMQG